MKKRLLHLSPQINKSLFTSNSIHRFKNVLVPPIVGNGTATIQVHKILLYTSDKISFPFRISCDMLCPTSTDSTHGTLGIYLAESTSENHCLIVDSSGLSFTIKPGVHHLINLQFGALNLFNHNLPPSEQIDDIIIELLITE